MGKIRDATESKRTSVSDHLKSSDYNALCSQIAELLIPPPPSSTPPATFSPPKVDETTASTLIKLLGEKDASIWSNSGKNMNVVSIFINPR